MSWVIQSGSAAKKIHYVFGTLAIVLICVRHLYAMDAASVPNPVSTGSLNHVNEYDTYVSLAVVIAIIGGVYWLTSQLWALKSQMRHIIDTLDYHIDGQKEKHTVIDNKFREIDGKCVECGRQIVHLQAVGHKVK